MFSLFLFLFFPDDSQFHAGYVSILGLALFVYKSTLMDSLVNFCAEGISNISFSQPYILIFSLSTFLFFPSSASQRRVDTAYKGCDCDNRIPEGHGGNATALGICCVQPDRLDRFQDVAVCSKGDPCNDQV